MKKLIVCGAIVLSALVMGGQLTSAQAGECCKPKPAAPAPAPEPAPEEPGM